MGLKLGCFTGSCDDVEREPEPHKLLKSPYPYQSYYIRDHNGNTKLHYYLLHSPGCDNLAKDLIERTYLPSFLNIKNCYGMTALHLAVMGDKPEIVRQLLVAGAHPMIKDKYGCIPLHYVCVSGNVDMIAPLTKRFDSEEIAKMKSKKLIICDLTESIHMENKNGEEPLQLAAKFGYMNIVKLLMEPQLY